MGPGITWTRSRRSSSWGSRRAWIVHGRDGLDEMSISGPTDVAILENDSVTMREVTPEDAGLKRWPLVGLTGGDAAHNAAALRRLLEGDAPGDYRDIVLLNAAAALIVAGKAATLREGATMAEMVLRNGRALAVFDELVAASNA